MVRSVTNGLMVFMILLLPAPMAAQAGLMTMTSPETDTLKTEKTPESQIITGPVADPWVYYDPFGDVYRIQTGLYAGTRHIGFESTYFHPGSSSFTGLYFGVTNFRDINSSSSAVWIGGLSVGRDIMFSNHERFTGESKTDLYFRIGPGISMAGRGIFDGRDSDYFLGFHTKALIGAQYNFSTNTSLYVHGGGRLLWFPALDEIRFTGIPLVSIGLQFSSSPQIPMVRF